MVANSGKLSTMSTTASNTLTDKVDSPHSGLFQALHVMAQGNYALKDHASTLGFAHTFAGGSSPTVAVTAGKVFSDGEYIAVDALTATALTKPSTGAFYHWVVASNDGDGTGTLSIVSGSTDGVVPDLNTTSVTVEKVPISLIKVQSTDTDSTIGFQYFTTSKEQNSLSLGYSATNVYTEMSKITAASGGTTVEVGTAGGDFIIDNTDQDKKIVMRLGTDTSATAFEVRNNSDAVKFGVGGDGSFTGLPVTGVANGVDNRIATFSSASALNGEANLTFDGSTLAVTGALTTTTTATVGTDLTVTGGDVGFGNGQDATISVAATTSTTAGRDLTISAGSTSTNGNNINGGDLILKSGGGDGTGTSYMGFQTKVSGTDTAAERMRIHTNGYIGIGEAAPETMLHLTSDANQAPQVTLENSGTDEAAPNEPEIIFKRNSTPSEDGDHNSFDIGTIKYNARDHAGTMHTFGQILCDIFDDTDGTEDGRFIFYILNNGASVQAFNMGGGQVVVNDGGEDINFRIESDDEEYMFFVDSGNNRISIGDSEDAPAATLEITNHATAGATGVPLLQLNSNDTDEVAVDINAANVDADVMIITADALTTAQVLDVSADALTTGSILLLHSNSADTSSRELVHIHNDHASATGTIALDVHNDSTGPVAKFTGNSALLAKVGLPETVAASAGSNITTYAGISGRATTVVLAASTTYTATTSDSGVVIVLTTTTSKVVLPDIPTTGTIGTQFTIINAGGGTISDGITTGDASNCKVNGSVPSSGQVSIADNETFTFIQFAADEWHKIG